MSLRSRLTASLALLLASASLAAVSASPAAADPPTVDGSWTPSPPSPIHLWQPSMVEVPDGRIFVVGQQLTPPTPPFEDMVDAGHAAFFDPATNSFDRVADPAHARVGDAVLLPDGRIAAFGGSYFASSPPGCPFGPGEVYDPTADAWTTIAGVPGLQCSGSWVSAVPLPDGRVLFSANLIAAIWDPATNTSTALPDVPAWAAYDMVLLDGLVYGLAATAGGQANVPFRFDPATQDWTLGDRSVGDGPDLARQVVVVDETTLLMNASMGSALVDTQTMHVTPLEIEPVICGSATPEPGVTIGLYCSGNDDETDGEAYTQVLVLDPAVPTWRATDVPYDPALFNTIARSITVGSGTYFAGLRGTFDGFVFTRLDLASAPSNGAPVAADILRTLRGGTSAEVRLSASDPDDDPLTFVVESGPSHGDMSGTAPDLTYTPDSGWVGADQLTYRVEDGRGGSDTATVSITVTDPVTGESGVTQDVEAGETVRTGDLPSAWQPTQVAVTSPVAGAVNIAELASGSPPSGFTLVGRQFRIEAPAASAVEPLRLSFVFDEDLLPAGQSAADVQVFRDGVPIGACTGAPGRAVPDPCVDERGSSSGIGRISVLSSHASEWTLAVAKRATAVVVAPVPTVPYGTPVSLTATVTQTGGAVPTGIVSFRDTSVSPPRVLGSAPVASDGTARLTGVLLETGEHAVVATYGGSGTSLPDDSDPRVVTIAKAPIVVVAQPVSLLAAILTGKFTFTATAVSAVTGLPVAGAAVTFQSVMLNGHAFGCTAVSNTHGVASCTKGGLGGVWATLYPQSYTAEFGATTNHRAGVGTGRMGL